MLDDLASQHEFELTVGMWEGVALHVKEVDLARQYHFAADRRLLADGLSLWAEIGSGDGLVAAKLCQRRCELHVATEFQNTRVGSRRRNDLKGTHEPFEMKLKIARGVRVG